MPASDMMLDEMPIQAIGMNASSTATGMVTIGTIADGMCQRKTRMTRLTITISSSRSCFRWSMARWIRSDRSYVVTMVAPSGSDGLTSSSRCLTRSMTARAFSPWRITTTPPATSPLPSRSLTPRRISGPSATWPTSRTRTGVPRASVFEDDRLQVFLALHVPAPAHHELSPAQLEQAPADLLVAAPHGVGHVRDRQAIGAQPVRLDRDLVLLDEPAEGRDLRHAGHRLQPVAQVPVLERAQVGRGMPSRRVDQRVLVDPADAGGIGPELGADALRQERLDLAQVLEHAAARPVEVGPVLEDHVHVRVAEVGEAADDLDARRPQQRGHDRIGDLVLDDVGAAVPARVDDHLCIREVGYRVDRNLAQGVDAVQHRHRGERDDEELVLGAEADETADHHFAPLRAIAERRLDSESSRKLADTTTRSPATTPLRTS